MRNLFDPDGMAILASVMMHATVFHGVKESLQGGPPPDASGFALKGAEGIDENIAEIPQNAVLELAKVGRSRFMSRFNTVASFDAMFRQYYAPNPNQTRPGEGSYRTVLTNGPGDGHHLVNQQDNWNTTRAGRLGYRSCWEAPSACTMEGLRAAAAAYTSYSRRYNLYAENCFTFACEMVAACAVDASSPRRDGVFNCSRTLMYDGQPPFADAGYGLKGPVPGTSSPSVNQTTPKSDD